MDFPHPTEFHVRCLNLDHHAVARLAGRYTCDPTAVDPLRADHSVLRSTVELDCVPSVPVLLEVLVNCALDDLPDAASLVEVDFEEGLATHQINLKRVEVGERPVGDHLPPLPVEL